MQSKLESFIETILDTGSGIIIAFLVSLYVFPYFGFHPSTSQNLIIVCIFTLTSIIRKYVWRRLFNKWSRK
jgi:hypothetical protein